MNTSMKVGIMMFKEGISPRLDIADSLLIYDLDTNTGVAARRESCRLDFDQPFQLVSFLQEKGISTILCGGCPQFFWRMLFFYGFDVVPGVTGDPEDLVKLLAAGKLPGAWTGAYRFLDDKGDKMQVAVKVTSKSIKHYNIKLYNIRFNISDAQPIKGDPEELMQEW
jgi:predicted Fe-Mo cluster-binding NifX family protein